MRTVFGLSLAVAIFLSVVAIATIATQQDDWQAQDQASDNCKDEAYRAYVLDGVDGNRG